MSNRIKEILNWFSNFNKTDVVIKTESKEFEIGLRNSTLPHLLGLHYSSERPLKGSRLYNAIKRLSDEQIYHNIEQHHPSKLEMVKSRVDNFQYFMENLESATLYEQTHPETKIKSDFLLVDIDDKQYLQLGLANNGGEDYLETFIVRHDDSYFKDSQIKEQVEGLYRLDDDMLPVPFSFDLEKNRQLEAQRQKKAIEDLNRDSDFDGLPDSLEYALGTNPFSADTDGDGVSDAAEVYGGSNPREVDKKEELQKIIAEVSAVALMADNFVEGKEHQKEIDV